MARKLLSKKNQQAEARAYMQATMDTLDVKASRLAVLAHISPSTITRTMKKKDLPYAPEMTTIFAINRVSGAPPIPPSLFLAYGHEPKTVIEGTPIPGDVTVAQEDGYEFSRSYPSPLSEGDLDQDLITRVLRELRVEFPSQSTWGELSAGAFGAIITATYNFAKARRKTQGDGGLNDNYKPDIKELLPMIAQLINQGSAKRGLSDS